MTEKDPLFDRKVDGGAILLQVTFEGRFTREQALTAARTVLNEAARIESIRKDILLEGERA
jgi:hypothetical protein